MALFSPKGYAIGNEFRKWLEAEEYIRLVRLKCLQPT